MARFFIHRPVLAIVLSLLILIAANAGDGHAPDRAVPPDLSAHGGRGSVYGGANAAVVEQAVAIPLEQQVNGADKMLYMASKSTNDGRYSLTCTFQVGTSLDLAAVDVQNRAKAARQSAAEVTALRGDCQEAVSRHGAVVRHLLPAIATTRFT